MAGERLNDLIEHIDALLDAEAVLYKINFKVDTIQQVGTMIKAYCPIHKDTMIRSLSIDPDKRRFRCTYQKCEGGRGGTFFNLYRLGSGKTEEEAARFWSEELGILDEFQVAVGEKAGASSGEGKEKTGEVSTVSIDANPDEPEDSPSDDSPLEDVAVPGADDLENLLETVVPEDPLKDEESALKAHGDEVATEESLGDFQARFEKAMEDFQSNKYQSALKAFQCAKEVAGSCQDGVDADILTARCFTELKKFDDAVALLEEAFAQPDLAELSSKEILYRMAEALERGGRTDNAVEVLEQLGGEFGKYRDTNSKLQRLKSKVSQPRPKAPRSKISFI